MLEMMRFPVVLMGLIAVLASACSSESPTRPTPAPLTPTSAPSAAATPAATATIATADVITLTFAAPVPSISNTVIFTVSGCFQCDGPDTAVQRHTTGADGKMKSETILESRKGPLAGYTLGLAGADATGAMLWAVACKSDYCGGLGLHPLDTWRVFWSFDAGNTWSVAYEMGVEYLSVSSAAGQTLAITSVTPGGPPSLQRYFLVDEKGPREVLPPPSAGAFPTPIVLTGGRLIWAESSNDKGPGRNTVFAADGAELITLPEGEELTYDSPAQRPDGSLMVGVYSPANYGFDIYAGQSGPKSNMFARDPSARMRLPGAYRFAGAGQRYVLSNATGDSFGLSDFATSYPVLIDLDAKAATPITAGVFTEQRGRNRFIAMTQLP